MLNTLFSALFNTLFGSLKSYLPGASQEKHQTMSAKQGVSSRVAVVAVASFAVLTATGYLAFHPYQPEASTSKLDSAKPLSQSVAMAGPVANEANGNATPVVTPDLTRVDASQFLDPIPVGKKAPAFTLKSASGETLNLSTLNKNKVLVLLFFQGSFCSVCGRQLSDYQAHLQAFKDLNANIIAISADDLMHSKKTVGEHGLTFPVLSNPDQKVIQSYGVQNIAHGGIAWPSAFVVDKSGIVRMSVANPDGKRLYSQDVLPLVTSLSKK